eukprot:152922_1
MPPRGKYGHGLTPYFGTPLPPYRVNQNALLIETRLKINCLLDQFDDVQLSEPLKQITQLFGPHSNTSLIAFIVQHSPQQKLQEMHKILKTEKLKHKNEMKDNKNENISNTNIHIIEKGS